MARLPTIQGRDVPRAARPMATVNPSAVAAPGRALAEIGAVTAQIGEVIYERESTAAAKERDTYASDEIRKLLYDPENGFTLTAGKDALTGRDDVLGKLEAIRENALKDLTAGARRKFEETLGRRIESAKLTVDKHTGSERTSWLDNTSASRVEAARQDALTGNGDISEAFGVIATEIRQKADRDGWDDEQLNLALDKAQSGLVYDQAMRMANTDPIAAAQYMRDQEKSLTGDDLLKLETTLQPEVKRATGRAMGREAIAKTGDMGAALRIARNTLGMNETQQNETLTAYLKSGGVDLDPAKTAWCAAFINATLAQAGIGGTGSNMARSFLNWGVEASDPGQGDVVVLSRGEPPFGHVGFVESINPDGSVVITGGNQGDSVSTATYPASRVLGFRRAVKTDDKSTAGAMQELINIPDPDIRAAAIAEFNLVTSANGNAAKAESDAAASQLFQTVEAGGSVDDAPLSMRQSIGRESMSALRTYEAKIKSGTPIETDAKVYYDLKRMQAEDPERFKKLDLYQYVDKLGQTDLTNFMDAQQKPPSAIDRNAASTLMTTASRHLKDAGIDGNEKQVAQVQTELLKWQETYVSDTGSKPGPLEIDQQVGRLIAEVTIDPSGLFNKESGFRFEVKDFDIGPDKLATSDVTIGTKVGDIDVPAGVINEQIAALKAAGQPVTPENLIARITDMLESEGLY